MATTISGDNGIDKVVDGSIVEADIANAAVTTNKIADANITPAKLSQKLTSGTAVASTSGTSIDFTGIPSWVKRITVMFNGVSTNGSSNRLIQIGAGSITTSGYVSSGAYVKAGGSVTSSTAGFVMWVDAATFVLSGHMTLTNVSGNIWVSSHSGKVWTDQVCVGGGDITLGGTLDRVRITTVNGTDAFDAGSINVMYEG